MALGHRPSRQFYKQHIPEITLLKKKGPRSVRFEGCYSQESVMATHKGVQLTIWVLADYARVLAAYPTNSGVLGHFNGVLS